MVLMIDNYDSFTYNIVQYLGEIGAQVEVVRNDEVTVEQVEAMAPSHIVLSPGPCTPNEAGICLDLIPRLAGRIPLFGICLGHQAIGQAFGGQVVRAREVMHGKTSEIHHIGAGVFEGLPSPLTATRYHSLIVAADSRPDCLELTAWTAHADGRCDEIMGLRHRSLPVEGVQFHPESILSEHGHEMLRNFLRARPDGDRLPDSAGAMPTARWPGILGQGFARQRTACNSRHPGRLAHEQHHATGGIGTRHRSS